MIKPGTNDFDKTSSNMVSSILRDYKSKSFAFTTLEAQGRSQWPDIYNPYIGTLKFKQGKSKTILYTIGD